MCILDAGTLANNFLGSSHSVWLSTLAASESDLHVSLLSGKAFQCHHRSKGVAGLSRLQHQKAQSSPSFEHPFSYPQTLFQGWRYRAVPQRVVFEHQYIFFLESSLACLNVSFAPLGSLDCRVSSYSFLQWR